jgi:hypothetical protein
VNIDSLLSNVGTQYARRAPAAALEWASQLGDKREDIGAPGQVMSAVITEVARMNPTLALDTALAMEETGNRQRSVGQVIAAIAQDEPSLAATLWQQLPFEFRPSAVMNIALLWAAQDAAAAERWIMSIPPGPERSAAIGPLLSGARDSTDISDYPRLVNLLESEGERDNHGTARIAQLVRDGNLAGAESELGRLNLSSDGYNRARSRIDTARQ